MDFFSRESKLATVIDPQVFQASQGAPAATGPQGIAHTAGLAPAAGDGPAETPLRGAHGSALKITLGSWKKAAGTVSFSCVDNQERATSRLTGLLSGASYSVFVVHLDVQGAGRFTPWGDAGRDHQQLHRRQQRHRVGDQQRPLLPHQPRSRGRDLAQ